MASSETKIMRHLRGIGMANGGVGGVAKIDAR